MVTILRYAIVLFLAVGEFAGRGPCLPDVSGAGSPAYELSSWAIHCLPVGEEQQHEATRSFCQIHLKVNTPIEDLYISLSLDYSWELSPQKAAKSTISIKNFLFPAVFFRFVQGKIAKIGCPQP
jgi:hypothetical protein